MIGFLSMSIVIMEKNNITLSSIRSAGLRLLAMREHSVKELHQKLGKRFPEAIDNINHVLIGLEQDDLQSDERYCEEYIRMRIRQGKGPIKITQELEEKGIMTSAIRTKLNERNTSWLDLASEVKRKRFGQSTPLALKEKAKQIRFLLYRGFSPEVVHAVVG